MTRNERVGGSFRDPSGFMFERDGTLYRQVNDRYAEDYSHLMASGLYDGLVRRGLMVPHEEVDVPPAEPEGCHKVLRPEAVPFVNYPYEWSFTQWKRAGLATLDILRTALEHGMILKDASAFNLQFVPGAQRPVFIDTLSFERYEAGAPWVAYRQFCRHFVAPLALMSHVDPRLGRWLRLDPEGVPLDLASRLLPTSTRWRPGLAIHLHMLARYERRYADARGPPKQRTMSKNALLGLVDSLRSTILRLRAEGQETEWGGYYEATNYDDAALAAKRHIVAHWVEKIAPRRVFDLGANRGEFSRVAAKQGASVVAFDSDPTALEQNIRGCDEDGLPVLPLNLDLTSPSPAVGWDNRERHTVPERGRADLVLALALIHHLAIGNNVPLQAVARSIARLGDHLIAEFVPKEDSQVQKMLSSREDVFDAYHEEGFLDAFAPSFRILDQAPLEGSHRRLYLMQVRDPGAWAA